jgi:8-hydroxy-5-deazaflavin:NADPH oxidoreductase
MYKYLGAVILECDWMKVGVLGSGDVGQVIATGFADLGHEVKMGTRDASKLKAWLDKTNGQEDLGRIV